MDKYLFCDMDPCAGSRQLIKPVVKNYLPVLKWIPVHGYLYGCPLLPCYHSPSVIRTQAY